MFLGFAYILVEYARVCTQVDEKLWRNQLFMFFSIFFIFISIVLFAVNGYSIFSYEGNRILVLFTEVNMYTFYMQYMYSVSGEEKIKIDRGQLYEENNELFEQHNDLLENRENKDCVDLEFDELPSGILNRSARKDQYSMRSTFRRSHRKETGRKEEASEERKSVSSD